MSRHCRWDSRKPLNLFIHDSKPVLIFVIIVLVANKPNVSLTGQTYLFIKTLFLVMPSLQFSDYYNGILYTFWLEHLKALYLIDPNQSGKDFKSIWKEQPFDDFCVPRIVSIEMLGLLVATPAQENPLQSETVLKSIDSNWMARRRLPRWRLFQSYWVVRYILC